MRQRRAGQYQAPDQGWRKSGKLRLSWLEKARGDEQEEADEAKKPVVTPLRGNRNTGGQQFLE